MQKSNLQNQLDPAEMEFIAIILSGPRRGYTETLKKRTYHVVMDFDEVLHFLGPDDERAQNPDVILQRVDNNYEINIPVDHNVWINGKKSTGNKILTSGDLLEIESGGTLVRYRSYPSGVTPRKTIGMVLADSINGASADANTKLGKISKFITNFTWDLATQTTLWFRLWVLIILTLLVISIVILIRQNFQLQQRVASEDIRIESIEEKLRTQHKKSLSQEDLMQIQDEVETQLAGTLKRLEELEAGQDKISQVIASASPSVVLILGTFGYVHPETGQLFRNIKSDDGFTTRYTFEENGEVVEVTFTGTAFAVSKPGILLTNKHVIEPWQDNPELASVQGRQLTPVTLKIFAYYPEIRKPIPLEIVRIDEQLDLALLQSIETVHGVNPLVFESRIPKAGQELLLLGYPTGLRALIARANSRFLESITQDGAIEFWTIADQLSDAGYIKPLVSRGIVSQVTDKFIVYDAETTFGGSGGPVLDNHGHVIAINAALIPEFGGSNMGIPAKIAENFIAQ